MRSEGDLKKYVTSFMNVLFSKLKETPFSHRPSSKEFEVVNFKLRCFLVEKKLRREKSRILEILLKCLSFLNLLFEFAQFSSYTLFILGFKS